MKTAIAALIFASMTLGFLARAQDQVPPEGKLIDAVATFFDLYYRLNGDIALNDTADPPWSEARVTGKNGDFIIKVRGDADCHYDLSDAIIGHQNGRETVDAGPTIASIAFGRLSREYQAVSKPLYDLVDMTVLGLPGAACDYTDHHTDKMLCHDTLVTSVRSSDARAFLRALKFVFDHGCKAAELPFYQ